MARNPDIRYINMYSVGSAARKIEPEAPVRENKTSLPQSRPRHKQVVYVDPLAICSIAVSVAMLVLMAVGIMQMYSAHQQEVLAQDYVQELYAENQQLRQEYESGYDLAQIEKDALALGLVPVDEVEHITVRVEPVQEPIQAEPTAWEALCAFFASIFA